MKFQFILLVISIGFVLSKTKDYDLKIEYKTKDNKLKKKQFKLKNKNQMNKAIVKEINKIFPNEIPDEIQEFLNTIQPKKSKKKKNLKSKKNKTNSNENMSYYFKINTQKILSPQQQKENNGNFENEESEYVFDGNKQHNESFDAEFFNNNGNDTFLNDDFFKKDEKKEEDDFFKKDPIDDDFFKKDDKKEEDSIFKNDPFDDDFFKKDTKDDFFNE